jgi:hypothetical protein
MKVSQIFLISVGLWWLGWLAIAKIIDAFPIGNQTVYLVVFSVLMFQLGGWMAVLLNSIHRPVEVRRAGLSVYKKNSIFNCKWIPVAVLIIQFVLLILSVKYFMGSDNFRDAVYEKTGEIWGSIFFIYLYDMLIFPIALVWIITRMRFGADLPRSLRIGFFILLLDSLIKMGRGSLYVYGLILLSAWLQGLIKISYGVFFRLIFGVATLSVLIFGLRYGGDLSYNHFDIFGYFFDSILVYHIVGFGILDQFTSKSVTFDSEHPPILWLGFIEGLLGSFLKFMGVNYTSLYAQLGEFLQGVVVTTEVGFYNAFGTNILPFYLDGGGFFSLVSFFLLGFLFSLLQQTCY